MNTKNTNLLLRNNTGNKDKNSLIDSFVIRTKPFTHIFNELTLSKSNKPEQNYLVIGQRGAGKTTLLYRLKYAIEDNATLSDAVIPIMFTEEQYYLMDLVNLWEYIAEYLEDYDGFHTLIKETVKIDSLHKHFEERVYETLEKSLLANNKKIIVFIENVDAFFKKIGIKEQKRLREVLTTSTSIRLICSATTYFDGIINYSNPFYEFFKIIRLDGLTKTESIKLLLTLGEQKNESHRIQKIIEQQPERLESIRRLTDGNPRIISYLFQIFLDNEHGNAIVDLYKLLDDITFLYKAELDQLSAQQQKIIDAMARNLDAISTKEIAIKINLDSKHISSILKTLEKNQIIEYIHTNTKNNLYQLKDRFLNIWYLMRFGKKREIENVIGLVRFYTAWCAKPAISKGVKNGENNLVPVYKGLGESQSAIPIFQKTINEDVENALINPGSLYMDQEEPDYEKAQQRFEEAIAKGDDNGYYLLGRLFLKQETGAEAESYLLTGVEKKDANAMHLLGHFYCHNGNWTKTEKFFLKSVKYGCITALISLFECAFQEKKKSRKQFILKQFEEHLPEINQGSLFSIVYARLLLWNDEIEKSIFIIKGLSSKLNENLDGSKDEEYKVDLVGELSSYFILLISKGQFNAANNFFQDNSIDYKQVIKPVYFALMNYLKKQYPLEHLKAGAELKETIREIMAQIEQFKVDY